MKLKRFLLRYDPPGIGFEVEDEADVLEVKHKPLPPAEEVRTVYDIADIVEELCNEEPGLLNMRKHGLTLTQLLGRLYKVQTSATDGRTDPELRSPSSEASSPGRERLREGQRVVITGLSGKNASFNGKVATILKAKVSKDKYEVCFSSDRSDHFETLKVKGAEHLLCLLHTSQPLAIGTCVVVCRLRNHQELNGSIGYVVECHENAQRYEVRTTQTHQLFRVKFENVLPVEAYPPALGTGKPPSMKGSDSAKSLDASRGKHAAEKLQLSGNLSGGSLESVPHKESIGVGSIIEIAGLKSNTSFNGEQAKVLALDPESRRYEILMSDGATRKLKFENARFLF